MSSDPITVEWFGCSTFRMRTPASTVMLDAYLDRTPAAQQGTTTVADITECDWIIVGHSHFDHLFGAERILEQTDARLIGSYETIRLMVEAGVDEDRLVWVSGGETIDLGGDVSVDVLPSLHSCVWSAAALAPIDEVCIGDLGLTWHEQADRMSEVMANLSQAMPEDSVNHLLGSLAGHSHRGDGGALVFRFRTPEGTMLFQDTAGYWTGIYERESPDVAVLAAAGRGNSDGEPVQGSLLDFLRTEVELLSPKRLLLCHHDDWLPGFSHAIEMDPVRALCDELGVDLLEIDYDQPTPLFPERG